MENQLHKNHTHHLEALKAQIGIANGLLKQPEWNGEQHEAISQGKAITEMMFECGITAFKK